MMDRVTVRFCCKEPEGYGSVDVVGWDFYVLMEDIWREKVRPMDRKNRLGFYQLRYGDDDGRRTR